MCEVARAQCARSLGSSWLFAIPAGTHCHVHGHGHVPGGGSVAAVRRDHSFTVSSSQEKFARTGRSQGHTADRRLAWHEGNSVGEMQPLTSALARAEDALFKKGAQFWERWQAKHGRCASALPTISTRKVAGIHMVCCKAENADANATPLVCLHGYGSGSGIYYNSLIPLAESWPGPVYVLDSPGCGLSDRPEWHLPTGLRCELAEAEDFWIDRVEAWREAMQLERMVLCGHSVGGCIHRGPQTRPLPLLPGPSSSWLIQLTRPICNLSWADMAVAYCEHHPSRVERLVLVSPVGVPPTPSNMLPHTPEARQRRDEMPFLFRTALGAWERGWGPFPFVRWGPGRWLMRGYVGRRFREAVWQDKGELTEYSDYTFTRTSAMA